MFEKGVFAGSLPTFVVMCQVIWNSREQATREYTLFEFALWQILVNLVCETLANRCASI